MEAPASMDRNGIIIQRTLPHCALCHRLPVDGRAASCGHTYCLICLKDIQITALLTNGIPSCKLCYANIYDPELQSVFIPSRILPPPNNASTSNASQTLTIGDVVAAMNISLTRPRNQNPMPNLSLPLPPPQLPPLVPWQHIEGHANAEGLPHFYNQSLSDYQVVSSMPKTHEKNKPNPDVGLKGIGFYLKGELRCAEKAKHIILNNGGRLSSGATKHTDYIVLGANAKTTKTMEQNGGTILNEDGFWALMKEKIEDSQEYSNNLFDGIDGPGYDVEEEGKLKEELSELEQRKEEIKRKLEEFENVKTKKRNR